MYVNCHFSNIGFTINYYLPIIINTIIVSIFTIVSQYSISPNSLVYSQYHIVTCKELGFYLTDMRLMDTKTVQKMTAQPASGNTGFQNLITLAADVNSIYLFLRKDIKSTNIL
jgi:hypothetical protein